MKTLTLSRLLLSGLFLSLIFSLSMSGFSLFFNFTDSFNISQSLTGLFYIIYLLKLSHLKTGRVSLVLVSGSIAFLMLIGGVSSELLLLFWLALIWSVRGIYIHRKLTAILCDAILITVGLFIASGVLAVSNSWFLCLWSFFFIQALLVFIADALNFNSTVSGITSSGITSSEIIHNKNFNQAVNTANQAIQQLSTNK